MNISKKLREENDVWALKLDLKFALIYHLHWDHLTAKNFIESLFSTEKKGLKNYWLQEKERKDQDKEHNAKLDEIARFVTKYINSKKAKG